MSAHGLSIQDIEYVFFSCRCRSNRWIVPCVWSLDCCCCVRMLISCKLHKHLKFWLRWVHWVCRDTVENKWCRFLLWMSQYIILLNVVSPMTFVISKCLNNLPIPWAIKGANLVSSVTSQKSTDFNAAFTVRFRSERHMWRYEHHPPYLINVATLPCEIWNTAKWTCRS